MAAWPNPRPIERRGLDTDTAKRYAENTDEEGDFFSVFIRARPLPIYISCLIT